MQRSYSDEERAGVLSLQMQGIGPSEISRRTGVALRTVERWTEAWREVAVEQRDEKLLTTATELAMRAQALQHDLLDAYEAMPHDELVKHANQINILGGTALDKAMALSGRSGGGNAGPFVIAIQINGTDDTPTVDVQGHIE